MKKSILLLAVSLVLMLGLLLGPLFFAPGSLVAYEVPKVKFFLVWSYVLLLFTFVVLVFHLELKIILPVRFKVVGIFTLILLTSAILGVNFEKSFFGNFYRWDGLVTFLSLISFSFCVYVLKEVVVVEQLTIIMLMLGFLLTFLWSVWQWFFNHHLVYAGFGNPVFLLGYVFVASPILLYGSEKYLGKRWQIVILAMLSMVGLMSKTVFGYLVPLFTILGLFFLRKAMSSLALAGFLVLTVLGGITMYYLEQRELGGFVFESRERIFRKSILAFADRPFMGWGYANFDAAFESVDWPIKINDDVYMDKAHSHLLENLVTTGVVGTVFYLLVLLSLGRDIVQMKMKSNRYLLLTLIFYLIHSQTNIVGISEEILFWTVFGLTGDY